MVDNTFYVDENETGIRIDKYLADQIDNVSRNHIAKLIADGYVSVNGANKIKANYKIAAGDLILVEAPEIIETEIVPEDIPLDVIYEDNDIIIVNKPKGMVVHPAPGHYTRTLVNALLYHCKDNLSGINGVLRPGIVHRIDKDTTGILVACKNDLAHNKLAKQLKYHNITRKYEAIVYGVIKEDEGTVNAPIGRGFMDRKKMAIDYNNGRDAITHYRVLERFKNYTHIECVLETGRTHQIRVHMASIHHPLLGDELYGPKKPTITNLQGQCLHARVLGFRHPTTEEYVEYTSELPEYFTQLLEKLRKMS